jgi:crossover junction endodeoxyribonuclease RusA
MPRVIIFEGEPRSTQHIYRTRPGGGVYMTSEAKALKDEYAWLAKAQNASKPPFTERLSVSIALFFKTKTKRDLDNFNKLILDALTGIVYEDDNQIDDLHIVRHHDPQQPRIVITVSPL